MLDNPDKNSDYITDMQKPALSRHSQKLTDALPHLPDRVLEAVVRSPGEDQVSRSQLLDVAKPLKLRRVNELHQQRVQLDVAVDGVVEHLRHKHVSSGKVWRERERGRRFEKSASAVRGFRVPSWARSRSARVSEGSGGFPDVIPED